MHTNTTWDNTIAKSSVPVMTVEAMVKLVSEFKARREEERLHHHSPDVIVAIRGALEPIRREVERRKEQCPEVGYTEPYQMTSFNTAWLMGIKIFEYYGLEHLKEEVLRQYMNDQLVMVMTGKETFTMYRGNSSFRGWPGEYQYLRSELDKHCK